VKIKPLLVQNNALTLALTSETAVEGNCGQGRMMGRMIIKRILCRLQSTYWLGKEGCQFMPTSFFD